MESQRFEVLDDELDSALVGAEHSLRVFCDEMRRNGATTDADILESALQQYDTKGLKAWASTTDSPYVLSVLEYVELQERKYQKNGRYHSPELRIQSEGHYFDMNQQSCELRQAAIALQMQLRAAIENGTYVEDAQRLLGYFSQGNDGQLRLLNEFSRRKTEWPFHDAFERFICIKRPYR